MDSRGRPKVTVGIVTRNRLENLLQAIRSVYAQEFDDLEILVVDNASEDGTAETLRRDYPDIRVIRLQENLGCPGGRNHVYANSRGDYIVNLDDDGYLGDGTLGRLVETFESDASIGIVGLRQLDFTEHLPSELPDSCWDTGLFRGGMSAFRWSMLEEIGVYPDDFFFFKEEEFLSLKALDAGWRIVYHPGIIMYHPLMEKQHSTDRSRDYYLYRNPLLVVVTLFPGLYMWKYLFLRTMSYAIWAFRRGSFQVYLRAIGAVVAKLTRTLFHRHPVNPVALRRYFALRGRLPFPGEKSGFRQTILGLRDRRRKGRPGASGRSMSS